MLPALSKRSRCLLTLARFCAGSTRPIGIWPHLNLMSTRYPRRTCRQESTAAKWRLRNASSFCCISSLSPSYKLQGINKHLLASPDIGWSVEPTLYYNASSTLTSKRLLQFPFAVLQTPERASFNQVQSLEHPASDKTPSSKPGPSMPEIRTSCVLQVEASWSVQIEPGPGERGRNRRTADRFVSR